MFVIWLLDTLNLKQVKYRLSEGSTYVDHQSCYEEIVKHYFKSECNYCDSFRLLRVK